MKKKKAPLGRRMKEFVKTSVVWGPLDHNLFFTIIFLNVYGIIMVYLSLIHISEPTRP